MLLQITVALLKITVKRYYKLQQLYQILTNYRSFWCYYKLRQHIITSYGRYYNLRRYYKLRRNSNRSHFFFFCKNLSCERRIRHSNYNIKSWHSSVARNGILRSVMHMCNFFKMLSSSKILNLQSSFSCIMDHRKYKYSNFLVKDFLIVYFHFITGTIAVLTLQV